MTSPGLVLLAVHATDLDSDLDYGRITYELSERTLLEHGDVFGLNASTGELFLKVALDYEAKAVYVLSVAAHDGGGGVGGGEVGGVEGGRASAPDHATVLIRVTDANDNPPVIAVNFLTSGNALHPYTYIVYFNFTCSYMIGQWAC